MCFTFSLEYCSAGFISYRCGDIPKATRLVLRSERHICHICFGTVLCHRVQGNPVQFADLANIKSVSEINGMYSLFLDSKVMFVLCDLILIFAVTVTTKSKEDKNTQQDNIVCGCYRRMFRIRIWRQVCL